LLVSVEKTSNRVRYDTERAAINRFLLFQLFLLVLLDGCHGIGGNLSRRVSPVGMKEIRTDIITRMSGGVTMSNCNDMFGVDVQTKTNP
jgi:hypothetical protein